eukprot:TRINITY_DN29506_c0_g1_i14.p1 TRINITY_DN29506_c0_g1~~TRINITY_DN29506_c0_g1_i14.p1  ORF type:complete len:204 (-),score=-5.66 TRINITY_DN29506_c0_g1_i14:199-810(-)
MFLFILSNIRLSNGFFNTLFATRCYNRFLVFLLYLVIFLSFTRYVDQVEIYSVLLVQLKVFVAEEFQVGLFHSFVLAQYIGYLQKKNAGSLQLQNRALQNLFGTIIKRSCLRLQQIYFYCFLLQVWSKEMSVHQFLLKLVTRKTVLSDVVQSELINLNRALNKKLEQCFGSCLFIMLHFLLESFLIYFDLFIVGNLWFLVVLL